MHEVDLPWSVHGRTLEKSMLAHPTVLQGVLQAAQQQVLPCVYICLCHGVLARELQIYMS